MFVRRHREYWVSEGDPELHVYFVTSHPVSYWEGSRDDAYGEILVTKSPDLEECCWDMVQAAKRVEQSQDEIATTTT